MKAVSRKQQLNLCQKITLLPGPSLNEILDLIRKEEPEVLKYEDSQWVFDTEEMKIETFAKVAELVTTRLGASASNKSPKVEPNGYCPTTVIDRPKTSSPPIKPRDRITSTPFEISGVRIYAKESGRLVCGACQKEFRVRSEIVVHVRTHTGEKPLVCRTCNKRFAHPSNLKAHERSHRGEKPYKCKVDGCGKSFAHSTSMKEHVLKHSERKPFKCHGCNKRFGSKAYLRKHIRSYHAQQNEASSQSK